MADITNPQAVRFCNENCRPLADLIERMDRTCDAFMLNVVRDFEAISEVGPDGQGAANSDVIADGAATDGRSQITKQEVLAFKYLVGQIRTLMATGDHRTIAHNMAVNSQPIY